MRSLDARYFLHLVPGTSFAGFAAVYHNHQTAIAILVLSFALATGALARRSGARWQDRATGHRALGAAASSAVVFSLYYASWAIHWSALTRDHGAAAGSGSGMQMSLVECWKCPSVGEYVSVLLVLAAVAAFLGASLSIPIGGLARFVAAKPTVDSNVPPA